MPTYDYVCGSCRHKAEIFESFQETPKKKCPECGKKQFERQFGIGAGVLFKGSGFYTTDYRSDGFKSAEKADTSSGSCSGSPASCTKPSCPAAD
jgi:putative FmdB family regulatory protein